MRIFISQIEVNPKNLEKVLNYLGIKKIEHVVEEEQDNYASLTLYNVSLQELNVISKL